MNEWVMVAIVGIGLLLLVGGGSFVMSKLSGNNGPKDKA